MNIIVFIFPLTCSFLIVSLGALFLHKITLCQFSTITKDCPGWDSVKISDKISDKEPNHNIDGTLNSNS